MAELIFIALIFIPTDSLGTKLEGKGLLIFLLQLLQLATILPHATKLLQNCYKTATKLLQNCYKTATILLQNCYNFATKLLQFFV